MITDKEKESLAIDDKEQIPNVNKEQHELREHRKSRKKKNKIIRASRRKNR